jgi:hypothetical protein
LDRSRWLVSEMNGTNTDLKMAAHRRPVGTVQSLFHDG